MAGSSKVELFQHWQVGSAFSADPDAPRTPGQSATIAPVCQPARQGKLCVEWRLLSNSEEFATIACRLGLWANHFRRLQANQLVSKSDLGQDECSGFELWEGPVVFRSCPSVHPASEIIVNILKQIGLTLLRLAKQVGQLPRTITTIGKQRRLQTARDAREVERLDRIRNPGKYRGKDN